jgi:hypothetical protein
VFLDSLGSNYSVGVGIGYRARPGWTRGSWWQALSAFVDGCAGFPRKETPSRSQFSLLSTMISLCNDISFNLTTVSLLSSLPHSPTNLVKARATPTLRACYVRGRWIHQFFSLRDAVLAPCRPTGSLATRPSRVGRGAPLISRGSRPHP